MAVTSGEERFALLDERERRIDSAIDRYAPYVGLLAGTALTPFLIPPTTDFWLVTGGLVAVAAVWSWVFATQQVARDDAGDCGGRLGVRASDPRLGAIYVAGLLLLMALLVHRSPLYGFMAIGCYAHSFAFLRGHWRWVGVACAATAVGYTQMGGSLGDPSPVFVAGWVALALLNTVVAGLFTYFGAFTWEQAERRRRVIAELNEANRRLEESLAENAALHARLVAQARESGVIDERARMAREIHDTLAQGLTGIVTQLEAADAADAATRRRHVDVARALARESLTEARRSVHALAPGRLAGALLPDAITDMAKEWAGTAGVDVHVEVTGEPIALLPDLEVTLYRVAQEALANVGRHASASRAGLTLSYMPDVVVLDVRDDGRGFDPAAVGRPVGGAGFGLAAMEQRVRRVSGELTVESAPGEGTAVSAVVPAIAAETCPDRGDR
ncbi:MAG: sensor histidine kinase [Pseudonocardiales bacterium]|nr:sensor histidine kinase [Pseudonocardiales bacterium]